MSLRDPSSLLLRAIGRRFAVGSVNRWRHIFVISLVAATSLAAEPQSTEKLTSPDGKYSVEVVRGRPSEDSLVISKGEEVIAKVPTPVGPVGSFFQTLWSPDGRYVAINKQRSSRPFPGPGGDSMWIVALATGKVLRQPDDALWNEVEEKASAFIDEKHLTETGGKTFLTLTAIGWEKDRLRFRLEAGFSEIEDRYLFDGLLDPAELKVRDWKVSKATASTRQ